MPVTLAGSCFLVTSGSFHLLNDLHQGILVAEMELCLLPFVS